MANLSNRPINRFQLIAQLKTIKLSTEDEMLATNIRQNLFLAFTLYISPLISNDLKAKGLDHESNRKIDAYYCFKVMIEEYKKNPNFFDHYDPETQNILKTAMLGRNAVIHCYLPLLLLESENYLLSWISVCRLINQPLAADQLQRVHQQIYAGADFPLRNRTDSDFSLPNFVDSPFLLRPENMSVSDFQRSLQIQVKMFEAESEFLGPALRAFLVNQPGGNKYIHSVMDSQSYLDDLITLGENNPWWPTKQRDMKLLKTAQFARNKLCHAELVPLLERHEEFLLSWSGVCDLIGKEEFGKKILEIRNDLKSLST